MKALEVQGLGVLPTLSSGSRAGRPGHTLGPGSLQSLQITAALLSERHCGAQTAPARASRRSSPRPPLGRRAVCLFRS